MQQFKTYPGIPPSGAVERPSILRILSRLFLSSPPPTPPWLLLRDSVFGYTLFLASPFLSAEEGGRVVRARARQRENVFRIPPSCLPLGIRKVARETMPTVVLACIPFFFRPCLFQSNASTSFFFGSLPLLSIAACFKESLGLLIEKLNFQRRKQFL